MSEVLLALLRVNLALAAATVLVLALRLPARRLFGAPIAYGLWAVVPLAVLAMLAPARTVTVVEAASDQAVQVSAPDPAGPVAATAPGVDPWLLLGGLWIAGALVSLAWLVRRQLQFGRALAERRAGPAVIGVLRPRVVIPADFAQRYTERERQVVLAHEQTHIARHDSRINAAVALARCVNWFNPAVHLLARYLRIDQEFACDAQVVAAHPTARKSYAEAMLKAQLVARPLPMGCYWPPASAHPLAQRIRRLSDAAPGAARRRLGAAAVALLAAAGGCSAWAARPADVMLVAAAPTPRPRTEPASAAPPRARAAPSGAEARLPAQARPSEEADTTPVARMDLAWADLDRPGPDPMPVPIPDPGPPPVPTPAAAPEAPVRITKIHSLARRSTVAPGSAVRVIASMVDRDGVRLVTDLTAFGSQSAYRTGYFTRKGSRYALFTSVRQLGDRLWVSASLDRDFRPETSGSIVLVSGQTGQITLGDGQVVTVTPTVRPETAQELEDALRVRAEREERWRNRDRGPMVPVINPSPEPGA